MRAKHAGAIIALLAAAAGCGPKAPAQPAARAEAPRPAGAAAATPQPDPLGPRPELPEPKPFTPPAPVVLDGPNGVKVWLLERHALPIVSVSVTVASGSADDPRGQAGLAHITASMLDEGAGRRSALELSSAINDLGATLSVGARADGSVASLSVLKKNFASAFSILADVVARPRFEPKEWQRVSALWQNDLRKRGDDPTRVSSLVSTAALFGPGTPYGHPVEGLLADAKTIGLPAVKAFYKAAWRPDRAVIAVVGDITRDEVMQAISRDLGTWSAKGAPASAAPAAKGAPASAALPTKGAAAGAAPGAQPGKGGTNGATAAAAPSWKPPRLVLVDRPGAPQSVISVVREGVAADDPRRPLLQLVNTALGGSFTSRLNQNLREDHGWSYGAASAFTDTRRQGAFVARASVIAEATGPALKEMLGELARMADAGLTPDELAKVQAQDRADLVSAYETANRTALRFATLARLGLPETFDATASQARQQATLPGLAELARAVDPKGATVVVVGPQQEILPQLKAIGLGEPEVWDVEGQPIQPKKAP
ncbi:M16 family metallopeptidase [Sorangium sp. So ce1335]|uniref:M16 family metallopeptidase n=1 Tax=Sorangium sp. So ce1335 TaxID=3133335 RepID=UPI003F635987